MAYTRLLCDSQDEQIAEHACSSTNSVKRTKHGSEPIHMRAPHALSAVLLCCFCSFVCVFRTGQTK